MGIVSLENSESSNNERIRRHDVLGRLKQRRRVVLVEEPEEPQKIIKADAYLLSHPRSGNHWVRFLVEWFSGRPTLGCLGNKETDIPIHKGFNDERDSLKHVDEDSNPILIKAHNISEIINNDMGIIIILRDPKETIVSHWRNINKERMDQYISLIKLFDEFEGNKKIIYYEDLINNPKKEITEILDFLNINKDRIEEFMEDYEYYFKTSVNFYKKNRKGRGQTEGKDLKFFTNNFLGKKDINFVKNYVLRQPDNIQSYLLRYL